MTTTAPTFLATCGGLVGTIVVTPRVLPSPSDWSRHAVTAAADAARRDQSFPSTTPATTEEARTPR